VTASALVYAAIVCTDRALTTVLNHDEHQFMASAYMFARHGLQPYRDFAYFHMPNLVYLYSLFFFTPAPFLTARLFNGLCAFGLCLTIFLVARSQFRRLGPLAAAVIAGASAILLSNNILFRITSCAVWNHSSAIFCAVLGFLLLSKAVPEPRPVSFMWSGFALGMATGIRLTFAPLFAPFLLAIVGSRSISWRRKGLGVLAFAVGALAANLPVIYFALTRYSDVRFDIFEYTKLSTRFYTDRLHIVTLQTWMEKLHHLFLIFWLQWPNSLIPNVALVALVLLGIGIIRRMSRPKFEVVVLMALLPFLLLGAFAPTPTQHQYFLALVPFLLLLGLYALASLDSLGLLRTGAAVVVIAAVISFFGRNESANRITELKSLLHPSSWVPLQVVKESRWLKSHVVSSEQGKVLTLSPIYAIEAGLPIYREFVTGPFGWRVSDMLSPEDAATRKLPWAPGIGEWLVKNPPIAVLTGKERKEDEEPIIREISRLGYSPVETVHGLVLWQALK
jgi:4-amino-4-deoxy-L-arabinose transferase-like glycosyltransferase